MSRNMGPRGFCICPKCNYKSANIRGVPCREEKYPNCGTGLIREGSMHYEKLKKLKGDD